MAEDLRKEFARLICSKGYTINLVDDNIWITFFKGDGVHESVERIYSLDVAQYVKQISAVGTKGELVRQLDNSGFRITDHKLWPSLLE